VNQVLMAVSRLHIVDTRFESGERRALVLIEFRGLFDGSVVVEKRGNVAMRAISRSVRSFVMAANSSRLRAALGLAALCRRDTRTRSNRVRLDVGTGYRVGCAPSIGRKRPAKRARPLFLLMRRGPHLPMRSGPAHGVFYLSWSITSLDAFHRKWGSRVSLKARRSRIFCFVAWPWPDPHVCRQAPCGSD
jgi:hypothetical protein